MDESANLAVALELIEPLGERELEILALFAEHRSNQEIADALILSLNTVKWYARQIYGKLVVANRQEAVERASQLGLLGEPDRVAESRPHNLPAQLTQFVGRQMELSELRRHLLDPGCRLLTITGPGGMGKTRLALEAAFQLVQDPHTRFEDGVFLSLLSSLSDASSVVSTVADAVGFRFYQSGNTPEQQLGQFLRHKHMLLVLDNFEHLIAEETLGFLIDLLAVAPGVSMLVTSRVRLNIQGEQLFPLHGLDVPQSVTQGETEVMATDGVKLFAAAARRANPTFVLNSTTLSPVIAICRLVEGMPLAIELAAAWMAVLEPAEILKEIRSGLDFLASDAANVPERQRSLPVVLHASWQLLSEAERAAMQGLSVFRGGFTSNATRQVAGVSPRMLLELVGKSWLQRDAEGRYQIHELLRQYAAEKLAEDELHENDVCNQHSLFYCQWLAKLDEGLRRRDQQASLNTITAELENMRSACLWAASQGLPTQLDGAINALGLYYRWHEDYSMGDRLFEQLARELTGVKAESGQYVLAQILTWRCAFRSLLMDRDESARLADAALRLMDSPALAQREVRTLQAHIELEFGYHNFRRNDDKAAQHFSHSYDLSEQIGDKLGMAYALVGLGRTCRTRYRFEDAESLLRRGVRLHESEGDQLGLSDALMALGAVVYRLQRFDEAERLFKQSLSISHLTDQTTVAQAYFRLSLVYYETGRFSEAVALINECLSLRRARHRPTIAWTEAFGGVMYRDMGDYEKSRNLGGEALALARASEFELISGMALILLGSIDLLEGDVALAYERLQAGVTTLLAERSAMSIFGCQAWFGFSARTLGQREEAWQYVLDELNRALHAHRYLSLLTALAGLALLLADDGKVEQAVALHNTLLEHAYITNARWFADLITPVVDAATARLSAEQRAAAKARGRAQDVWETAAGLVAEAASRPEPWSELKI